MRLLQRFWNDEAGAVMTAELAMLGTVGVLGGVVGLNMVAGSVNEELGEVAYAFRSLDQSYAYQGQRGCGASVAGACYRQQDVETSLAELGEIEELEGRPERSRGERGDHHEGRRDHGDRRHHREGHERHEGDRHDGERRNDGDRRPRFVPKDESSQDGRPDGPRKGSRRRAADDDLTNALERVQSLRLRARYQA